MEKKQLDEVLACLGNERRVVSYFKDQYAVEALKRFVGTGKTVAHIKHSRFAGLLNKPWIKSQLANVGSSTLSAELLSYWYSEDMFYFDLTLDTWGGECRAWQQTTRSGYNLVLQLNFTKSHDRDYDTLPNNYDLCDWHGHPVHEGNRHTVAWARIDISEDLSEALIEEIQSDWLRAAKSSLQYAKRRPRHGTCCGREEKQHKQRFEKYFTQHIKPVAALWDEAILNTALSFLFDNVGVENVYYHDFATGAKLKKISYSLPPKSLYSTLPKQFGFAKQQQLPQFLARHRQVRNAWKKCEKPAIFKMARTFQENQ